MGFAFLGLAIACAAVTALVYHAPPASLGFGMQIVIFVLGALGTIGFGFLAGIALLFGSLS